MNPSRFALALVMASLGLAACGPDDLEFGTRAFGSGGCPVASNRAGCARDGGQTEPDAAQEPDSGGGGDDGGRSGDGGVPIYDAGGGTRDAAPMCPAPLDCRGHCNDDDGSDYDRCIARGNVRGCTDEMFRGWCSRRVGDGLTWISATRSWATMGCDGTVTLERGRDGYDVWVCRRADGCSVRRCSTPLVLVFEGDVPVPLRADDGRASFDLAARGDLPATRTDWPTDATPWLVLDRNGDGRITSGEELFGSATPTARGVASHGFEALADLDANHDGVLDARDPDFAALHIWRDHNGDRVSDTGELVSLAAAGVETLELGYVRSPRCDARGNCEIERAGFTWRDGAGRERRGAIVDVHFAVR